MSGEAFAFSSSSGGVTHVPSPKSNPQQQQQQQPAKRKRIPGTPDPDAEVIALSPKTLMATHRFVCEICNKGFQRDQNLQLHRRGHNLPWKLRQRAPGKEPRKRVYVCPEPSCVHHDPFRALGDLTGIKKHYSRKHGEKRWNCEKCSKRYAVFSDWKAHSKICGTREYKCDCGALFSRKDSFTTHRAFCEALAQESMWLSTTITADPSFKPDETTADLNGINRDQQVSHMFQAFNYSPEAPPHDVAAAMGQPNSNLSLWLDFNAHLDPLVGEAADCSNFIANTSFLPTELFQMASTDAVLGLPSSLANYGVGCSMKESGAGISLSSTSLVGEAKNVKATDGVLGEGLASLYSTSQAKYQSGTRVEGHMSATALLHKAAQMGATASDRSASSVLDGPPTSPKSAHRLLQSSSEFQRLGQEKAMTGSFQELIMSPFSYCQMLTEEGNNVAGLTMETPPRSDRDQPLGHQPPSFLTRDFLGLGQEVAWFAPGGSGRNLVRSSKAGVGSL